MKFSDCHYLATLMNALAEALSSKPVLTTDNDFDMETDHEDDLRFYSRCLDEIDRYRRLDEWIPSYHNVLSSTALDCKRRLAKAGAAKVNLSDFLQYTRDETFDDLRLNAFRNLTDLGIFQSPPILRWFLFVMGTDPSPYVRDRMLHLFGQALGAVAIGENSVSAATKVTQQGGLIIEQESTTAARQADLARRQTVLGALAALKTEIGSNAVLKEGLWTAITSPTISLREMGELLDVCAFLYTPESSMIVVMKYPRYWKCTKTGKVSFLSLRPRFMSPTSAVKKHQEYSLTLLSKSIGTTPLHTHLPHPHKAHPQDLLPKIEPLETLHLHLQPHPYPLHQTRRFDPHCHHKP